MSDIDISEISTKFECVKVSMRHTKDGHVFSMAIHPSDTPEDFLRDPVGQRYLAVLVRLDGHDQPVPSPDAEEGARAIKLAGTLCHDKNFIEWLAVTSEIDDPTEDAASVWLRKNLKVTSRRELKTDKEARKRLDAIRNDFILYMRNQ